TKQLEIFDLPSLCSWAVKKRRTAPQSAQFIQSFYYLPSTIFGKYPQLLTYPETCFIPCQIGNQNSNKESTIIYPDEIESPNTPPQTIAKKRKLDCLVGLPIYIIPKGDSSNKEIFPQLSWVGSNDASALQNQGSDM
ncbi:hypothetical protein KI387_038512, partial [Taxus chinensis]